MRGKINEFFDKLEFTNDVEGKKVAVITTDASNDFFTELVQIDKGKAWFRGHEFTSK